MNLSGFNFYRRIVFLARKCWRRIRSTAGTSGRMGSSARGRLGEPRNRCRMPPSRRRIPPALSRKSSCPARTSSASTTGNPFCPVDLYEEIYDIVLTKEYSRRRCLKVSMPIVTLRFGVWVFFWIIRAEISHPYHSARTAIVNSGARTQAHPKSQLYQLWSSNRTHFFREKNNPYCENFRA